jgi:hypothetical protein
MCYLTAGEERRAGYHSGGKRESTEEEREPIKQMRESTKQMRESIKE